MSDPGGIRKTEPEPIEVLMAPNGRMLVRVRKGESIVEREFGRRDSYRAWVDSILGVPPSPSEIQ